MKSRVSNLLLLVPAALLFAPVSLAQQTLFQSFGTGSGGNFGASVTIIGDVNGDNRDDFAVGLPSDDQAGLDTGRVHVRSGMDGSLLYTVAGLAAGDQFGFSLANFGGDLNSDGIFDFAVGAPTADPGGLSNAGQVRVLSGANGSTIATFNGAAAGDRFGYSVASAGSYLGAYRMVVGAPYRDHGATTSSGSAYVYFATGGFLNEYSGTQTNEHLGWSVAGGEDVNADGKPDIVAGAPDWDDTAGGLTDCGRVRVYSAVSSFVTHQTQTGGGSNHRMGAGVAMLKKWDADTNADFAVGMPGAPFGGTSSGGVYVFSGAGGAILDTLTAFASNDHAGSAIASLGDVNNDGRTDLIVGMPDADPFSINEAGSAKVFSGMTAGVLYTITGGNAGAHLGAAVGGGGDVNNDNRPDFVIGAPDTQLNGPFTGQVVVRSGLNGTPIHTVWGPMQGDNAGRSVANVGDVNGDGKDDWAVGIPYYDTYNPPPFALFVLDSGKVEIRSGANGSLIRSHSDLTAGGLFGYAVAGIGDVNNDGRPDYAIGQPKMEATTAAPGEVFIYSGLTGTLLANHIGPQNGDAFGFALSGCGDVNANGELDVLVGLPTWDNGGLVDAGRVEARNAISGTISLSRSGLETGAQLGYSVAGLYGDVTNDVVPQVDIVVGAPFHDNGVSNRGRVYVLAQPSNIVYTIDGVNSGDLLGYSVAGIGDVNFDGKVDFAAGSPGAEGFFITDGGIVRAYSGANGAQLWSYLGLTNEHVGTALSKLGDLDKDGAAEIAVGGNRYSFILPTGPGLVDVVSGRFGSRNLRLDGDSTGDGFGQSVAGLGDITGDGIGELLVGAPYSDIISSQGGMARVYDMHPLGWAQYGTGTPGCDGTTSLNTNGPASIGNSAFRFHSANAPATSLGLLVITDVQDLAGTDLFAVGILLHVGFGGATEVYTLDMPTDALGYSAANAPIPNAPALVGKKYYAQSIWLWSAAECTLLPYNLSSSVGAEITIQN